MPQHKWCQKAALQPKLICKLVKFQNILTGSLEHNKCTWIMMFLFAPVFPFHLLLSRFGCHCCLLFAVRRVCRVWVFSAAVFPGHSATSKPPPPPPTWVHVLVTRPPPCPRASPRHVLDDCLESALPACKRPERVCQKGLLPRRGKSLSLWFCCRCGCRWSGTGVGVSVLRLLLLLRSTVSNLWQVPGWRALLAKKWKKTLVVQFSLVRFSSNKLP